MEYTVLVGNGTDAEHWYSGVNPTNTLYYRRLQANNGHVPTYRMTSECAILEPSLILGQHTCPLDVPV